MRYRLDEMISIELNGIENEVLIYKCIRNIFLFSLTGFKFHNLNRLSVFYIFSHDKVNKKVGCTCCSDFRIRQK